MSATAVATYLRGEAAEKNYQFRSCRWLPSFVSQLVRDTRTGCQQMLRRARKGAARHVAGIRLGRVVYAR